MNICRLTVYQNKSYNLDIKITTLITKYFFNMLCLLWKTMWQHKTYERDYSKIFQILRLQICAKISALDKDCSENFVGHAHGKLFRESLKWASAGDFPWGAAFGVVRRAEVGAVWRGLGGSDGTQCKGIQLFQML